MISRWQPVSRAGIGHGPAQWFHILLCLFLSGLQHLQQTNTSTADFPFSFTTWNETNYMNKHFAFVTERASPEPLTVLGHIMAKLCCRHIWHKMNVGTQYQELNYASLRQKLKGFCHSVSLSLTSPPTSARTSSEVLRNLKGESFAQGIHRNVKLSLLFC